MSMRSDSIMRSILSRYIQFVLCAALALSCSKAGGPEGKAIMFALPQELSGQETKASITNTNITSNTVRVYALKNNAEVSGMSPATITKQASGYWRPTSTVLWDDGKAYSFQGYGYTATGFSAIASDGMTFTVTQPSSYEEAAMADYIVSNKVEVSASDSNNHPLVVLEFNHILPSIVIYVTKAEAMKDVKVSNLTLSGLYYGATLTYNEISGKWLPSYTTERDASYSSVGLMDVTRQRDDTEAIMSIISVPQGFTQVSRLSVTYRVDESMTSTPQYKEYTESFALGDYASEVTVGHRAVFHLTVDTGIHLTASIAPWNKIDFIEGMILPSID